MKTYNLRFKFSMHTVILLFVALFPIIPAYFKIVGFTASNILCTLFVICYFLSWDKKETLALQKLSFYILAWFFCCSMIELIHDYQITTPIFLLVRMVAIFFLLPNKINTRERFLSCIDAVICISAVVSVLGIVEEITNLNVFELLNTSGFTVYNQQIRFGIRRIVSFASQTISYCVYQIFIGALIFYRITLLTDSKKKKWFQVCYLLSVFNAFFTLSRSAILFYLLEQLLLLYRCGLFKAIRRVITVCIGICGLLFLLWLFCENVFHGLIQILYMFPALFDEGMQNQISSGFGGDNISGIGNRIDLYKWIWEVTENHRIFGVGNPALFSYTYLATDGIYSWYNTKKSIEVEWLSTYYEFGFIGLFFQILMYLKLLIYSIKHARKRVTDWERKLNFNFVCFSCIAVYILQSFAISHSVEENLFFLLIAFMLAYNTNHGFVKETLF